MEQDISGVRQKAMNDLVVPFRSVRRSIGTLGLFLPVSLIFYGIASGAGVLDSMSAYFYSPMREIFVGTLCALAVFLWTYEGYRMRPGEWLGDRTVARLASFGAGGTALLPTTPDIVVAVAGVRIVENSSLDCTISQCLLGEPLVSMLHFFAAALFFGAMAVFCLVLFTRGDTSDPNKRALNRVYRLCGWTIVSALALIGVLQFTHLGATFGALRPVFWLEVAASLAIAISWMVKGDAMQPLQRMLARQSG